MANIVKGMIIVMVRDLKAVVEITEIEIKWSIEQIKEGKVARNENIINIKYIF